MSVTPIAIDPLSVTSLLVQPEFNGNVIATATGFSVEFEGKPWLITNWHVVTGRHADTGRVLDESTGAIPDALRVTYHKSSLLGAWVQRREPLFASGATVRWKKHPRGQAVDVVALPLTPSEDVKIYPVDLSWADTDVRLYPAMPVSIIGYPAAFARPGLFPIWKTGHIASDPDLPYAGRPVFIIDATTRGGMSGSPVVARPVGAYASTSGAYNIGGATRLLGVYSSRVDAAELGYVWRPQVIKEILNS